MSPNLLRNARRVCLTALPVTGMTAALVIAPPATMARHAVAATRASHCAAPNTRLLKHRPKVKKLPDGAQLRVWDTGRKRNGRGLTLSEVYVPASSSLRLHVWAAHSLTSSEQPTKVLRHHRNGVAIMNAGVFDPSRGSLPQGAEVMNGVVDKARKPATNVVAISSTGQLGQGMINVTGSVTAAGGSQPVTGLNWQSLAGSGVNIYTTPWGHGHRPRGRVQVVVHNDVVRSVRHSDNGRTPRRGEQVLTATGSSAVHFLGHLKSGQRVLVDYGYHVAFHYSETPFKVVDAVDHDAPYWLEGKKWPVPCTERHERLWSRTALGYDRHGDFFLVTTSGPDGGRYAGGATASNLQYYLKQLGAYNADGFDDDTSTTLAVRTRLPGRVIRVDKPGSSYQRAVPNYLAIS